MKQPRWDSSTKRSQDRKLKRTMPKRKPKSQEVVGVPTLPAKLYLVYQEPPLPGDSPYFYSENDKELADDISEYMDEEASSDSELFVYKLVKHVRKVSEIKETNFNN